MRERPGQVRRVLMTTDAVGGVWTYALDLAAALATYGVGVDLATLGPRPDELRRRAALAIPNLRLFESEFALEWQSDPWLDVERAGAWIADLAERLAPDLVHFNHFTNADLSLSVPKIVVAHSDVRSWFRGVRGHEAGPDWEHYGVRVARGLRAADLVIAPTAAMLASAARDYGPFRASRVIPNGRDAGVDAAPDKEDFVLTAGRLWDEGKNISALDAAARDLAWPVLAAGDDRGPEGGRRSLAHARGLGFVAPDRMADLYARAAIYCLPARYEPFGLSALEAAAHGCALVLGDLASLREVWGDAALFVDPCDADGLRLTLAALIADPARRLELGRRARARAADFTTARMGQAYLTAYADLTASSLATAARVEGA